MTEVIDELLVRLGLETDRQQFQQAEANFSLVRRGLMGIAGVATTALTGVGALSTKLARDRHVFAASAEALNLSASAADELGFALERAGGSADNAISTLKTMRDLRDQYTQLGQGGLVDASMFGIDAQSIANAGTELEALLELNRQFQSMNQSQQNLALDALGISGTGIQNLLRGGPTQFQSELELAAELRQLTQKEIDVSRELSQSMDELSRAMDELGDGLVKTFAPALTKIVDKWVNFLTGEDPDFDEEAYRRSLTNHAGMPAEAFQQRGDGNTTLLEAVAEVESGGRHRDANGNLITSPTGAQGMYQIIPGTGRDPGYGVMPLQNNTQAEHERFAQDYLGALSREFESEELATIAYNAGPGTLDRWLSESDDWRDAARRDLQSDVDHRRFVARQALDYETKVEGVLGRELRGGSANNGGQVVTIEINGAQDPVATAEEVERVLRRTADNSRQDMANGVY